MQLSVVIPAFNESKTIANTVNVIITYFKEKGLNIELLVVDDGSRDNTLDVLKTLDFPELKIIENVTNHGKGYSVRKGVLAAKGDYILFSDADLSTPIKESEKFLDEIKNFDIAIGSRRLKNSDIKIRQPFYRVALGRVFSFMTSVIVLSGIKDTQCGFKMFRREVGHEIFKKQRLDKFAFDVEVLFIASLLDYSIKEIPVEWHNNRNSKVNPIKDPLLMLKDMLVVRLNHLRGYYK